MKKTTYTLIILCVLAIAAAFAFPPLTFVRFESATHVIRGAGGKVTIATETFMTLDVTYDCNVSCTQSSDTTGIRVTVTECDGLTRPQIVIDRKWQPLVSLESKTDTLCLTVNYPKSDSENNRISYVEYTPDLATLAEIRVPRGMLHNINAGHHDLVLRDFSDAELTLDRVNSCDLRNSDFRRLNIP